MRLLRGMSAQRIKAKLELVALVSFFLQKGCCLKNYSQIKLSVYFALNFNCTYINIYINEGEKTIMWKGAYFLPIWL